MLLLERTFSTGQKKKKLERYFTLYDRNDKLYDSCLRRFIPHNIHMYIQTYKRVYAWSKLYGHVHLGLFWITRAREYTNHFTDAFFGWKSILLAGMFGVSSGSFKSLTQIWISISALDEMNTFAGLKNIHLFYVSIFLFQELLMCI